MVVERKSIFKTAMHIIVEESCLQLCINLSIVKQVQDCTFDNDFIKYLQTCYSLHCLLRLMMLVSVEPFLLFFHMFYLRYYWLLAGLVTYAKIIIFSLLIL